MCVVIQLLSHGTTPMKNSIINKTNKKEQGILLDVFYFLNWEYALWHAVFSRYFHSVFVLFIFLPTKCVSFQDCPSYNTASSIYFSFTCL